MTDDEGGPSLSEMLLRDLRVVDVRVALLRLGGDKAVALGDGHRAVLHLIMDGSTSIAIRSEDCAATPLNSGDAVLVFYGDRHTLGQSDGVPAPFDVPASSPDRMDELSAFTFGSGTTATVLSCSMKLGYRPPALYASRTRFWPMYASASDPGHNIPPINVGSLTRSMSGAGTAAMLVVTAEFYLFHAMRQIFDGLWHGRRRTVGRPDTRQVTHALQALHSQMSEHWTVASLATLVGMSRSGFAAAFADQVGSPPLHYLTSIRMERAARLLEIGMQPMAEVARRIGYSGQASFARAYSAYHGVSPIRYLRGHRRPDGQAEECER